MSEKELRSRIAPLTNEPVIIIDDNHARTEWESRNQIRFCNIFSLRDGIFRVSIAICESSTYEETALREAFARINSQ